MQFLFSDRARFVALCLFVALVMLTGGSSRPDVMSLAVLRPAAILFAVYALWQIRLDDLLAMRAPLFFMALLGLLIGLQLIPLPPFVWQALPGRELQVEITQATGLVGIWRPLSLVPSRTMNALLSLTIPVAAMLLYAVQAQEYRRKVIPMLLIAGGASAVFAFMQSARPAGVLYLYRHTNEGSAVGLLANRNHQAVLMALLVVAAAYYGARPLRRQASAAGRIAITLLMMIIFALCAIITGSRAGLICTALALVASMLLLGSSELREALARQSGSPTHRHGKGRGYWLRVRRFVPYGAAVLVAGGLVLLSQSDRFSTFYDRGGIEELRWLTFPYLVKLIGTYFPFGSGMGSFEFVYRQVEPTALLNPAYLNNAHNDWLQLAIEGGLPLMLIWLWILIRAARTSITLWLERDHMDAHLRSRLLGVACVAIIAVAALFDYALRVPALMMFTALLAVIASAPLNQNGRRPSFGA